MRSLYPIMDPTLTVGYVVIEPAVSAMPRAAALFLNGIEEQYRLLKERWARSGEEHDAGGSYDLICRIRTYEYLFYADCSRVCLAMTESPDRL